MLVHVGLVAGVFCFQEVTMTIQIVCAWCGKSMGTKQGDTNLPVSHSICPDCAEKTRSEMDKESNNPNQTKKGAPMPCLN